MLPLMASSISASDGFDFLASSAAADMICPDWQYPHCGTSSSIHAFCTGCDASVESPSMVVIFFPATLEIGVMHERAASPLICTLHAPQSAIPHPNFVPVIFNVSRSTHSRGICGSSSTVVDFPFNVKVTAMATSPSEKYRTPIGPQDGNVRKSTAQFLQRRTDSEGAAVSPTELLPLPCFGELC